MCTSLWKVFFSVDYFNTSPQTIGTVPRAEWESNHTSFYCLIGFCSAATRLLLPNLPTFPSADIILFLFFFFYNNYIIIFINYQLNLLVANVGFEPRLKVMSLMCCLCTTSAIYRSRVAYIGVIYKHLFFFYFHWLANSIYL